MPRVTQILRYNIINLLEDGMGARAIKAHLLQNRGVNLQLSTISKIITKWRVHHTTGDLPGRGARRTARTNANVIAVRLEMNKDVVVSSPKRTPKRLGMRLGISKDSIRRILKYDLQLKPFRKVKACKLSCRNNVSRLQRATALLHRFNQRQVRSIVFSDESNFDLASYCNKQNSRIYAENKAAITPDEILLQKSTFPTHIMVFFALSYDYKFPPIFIPAGQNVNAVYYQDNVLTPCFLSIQRQFGGRPWTFQQDSAPPHRAISTQDFIRQRAPNFISSQQWPPNSSDLAVLDYGIFADLKALVYSHRIADANDLMRWIRHEWNRYPQHKIQHCIDSWRTRLHEVVNNNGGHIRYL